jgi:hypothetical protein
VIAKGAWRIALVAYEDGRFLSSGFIHAGCAQAFFETADVMPRLERFSKGLSAADLSEVGRAIAAGAVKT